MDFKAIAKRNKILEIRVGSHLFGTNTPESDTDWFGIFMPCDEMVYGFQRCEEVDLGVVAKDETGRNTADAVDFKVHEYRKFVRLAMQNNPNILHVLFANKENVFFSDSFGQNLLVSARMFPHKGAHHRFVKYADSQRHKMRIKPEKYAELIQGMEILEGLPDFTVMGELREGHPPFKSLEGDRYVRLGDLNFEAGVYVKKARGMVRERLSKATSRTSLFTKYGYDTKFASNLIQLLKEGIELMETGWVVMPLQYRQEILDIKQGKLSVETVLKIADDLVEEARDAYEHSDLPARPRVDEIEQFAMGEVKAFLDRGTG